MGHDGEKTASTARSPLSSTAAKKTTVDVLARNCQTENNLKP